MTANNSACTILRCVVLCGMFVMVLTCYLKNCVDGLRASQQ